MELWTRKAIECCKQNLNGYSSRSLKDSNKEGMAGCGGPAQEVSEGNSINNWITVRSCDISAKNLADSCPSPKKLPEAKVKSNEQISLAQEISRICGVVLNCNSYASYNEKATSGTKEIQNVQLEEKQYTRKLDVKPRPVLKEQCHC